MNIARMQELAALEAAGALTGPEQEEFGQMVAEAELVLTTVREFRESVAGLAAALPTQSISASIKNQLFQKIFGPKPDPKTAGISPEPVTSFSFISGQSDEGWHQLPVPGASFKLLAKDQTRGYLIALGRLAPNTRYPAHAHRFAEDIYLVSGDLTVNGRRLVAGDFHRAESGSWHDENFSTGGCTVLLVLSDQDLAAQIAAATT